MAAQSTPASRVAIRAAAPLRIRPKGVSARPLGVKPVLATNVPSPEHIRKGVQRMPVDLENLEDQFERLRGAIRALMALQREPQDRLNRALSQFSRVFKYEPTGAALDPYQRIYRAIGDPPVGTTLSVSVGTLSSDEQDDLVAALLELHDVLANELVAARSVANA